MEIENPMVRPIKEQKPVAKCEECEAHFWVDDEFLSHESNYFCDEDCLMDYLGVIKVEGWEIK